MSQQKKPNFSSRPLQQRRSSLSSGATPFIPSTTSSSSYPPSSAPPPSLLPPPYPSAQPYPPVGRYEEKKRTQFPIGDIPTGEIVIGEPEVEDRLDGVEEGVVVEGLSSQDIGGDEVVEWNSADTDPELVLSKSNLVATTEETNGLAYLWSGARASHGVIDGKHVFEIKILPHSIRARKPSLLRPRLVIRIGWSTLACRPYDLGFTNDSFGLENTGMLWENDKESQCYKSSRFGPDDVVTCAIDLQDSFAITYYINGRLVDASFIIPSDLRGYAFFPHVLISNSSVQANFYPPSLCGSLYPGFTFLGNAPDYRVTLYRGPRSQHQSELLVMCGLPWTGKTTWALKYARENQEKCFDIVGQDILQARLRRQLANELKFQERSGGFNEMNELLNAKSRVIWKFLSETVFPKSQRNYILDESASFDIKRYAIVAFFEGFRKIAVLIVPSDLEWRNRRITASREGTTKFRSATVMETIQRNYLPPPVELFSSIIYPELPREDANMLLANYRQRPIRCVEWPGADQPLQQTGEIPPSLLPYPTEVAFTQPTVISHVPMAMSPAPKSNPVPMAMSPAPPHVPLSPGDLRKRKGPEFPAHTPLLEGYSKSARQQPRGRSSNQVKKSRPEVW